MYLVNNLKFSLCPINFQRYCVHIAGSEKKMLRINRIIQNGVRTVVSKRAVAVLALPPTPALSTAGG